MPEETTVVFCLCSSHGMLPEDAKLAVLNGLRAAGAHCTVVEDLCGLAAARDPSLSALASPGRRLTFVACHPRAVRWLLSAAGVPAAGDGLQILDLRTMTAAEVLARLRDGGPATAVPQAPAHRPSDGWRPWFPVIDYDRCKQCRQCLSFCLFGVYALSPDGKVVVANPRKCKDQCPACARICPEAAIMFPKLGEEESPLNGAEVGEEAALRDRARIHVQEILGTDVYAALAKRRRQAGKRRHLKTSREQAETERVACSGGERPESYGQTTRVPPGASSGSES